MRISIGPFFLTLVVAISFLLTDSVTAQFELQSENEVKVTARYHIESGKNNGFLIVKLDISPGSYIYSMTQGEPLQPSKLVVKSSKAFTVGKKFKCDKQPQVIEKDPVFQTRLEKHSGTVQFYVPIRLTSVTTPKSVRPEITFSGQVCSDQGYCVPISGITAKAKFAGFFEREAKNSVPPLKQKK